MENRNSFYENPFFEPDSEYASLRFHVFGVPQTPTHSDFSADAFAQKIRMLCWGLKSTGHTVFHYGNELSLDAKAPEKGVLCDEHISVTTEENLMDAYPNCREQRGIIDYLNPEYPDEVSYLNEIYCLNTARAVRKRFKKGDYICYGIAPHSLHSRLVSLKEAYHIESGIGYLSKPYLPYFGYAFPFEGN